MALRPSVKPRFATTNLNNGPLGGANVTEPSELKKDSGWDAGEKPPRETFNWLHRITYLWIDYLDELALNSLQKSNNLSDLANVAAARANLGLGPAALKPVDTDNSSLITIGAADVRYLNTDNNLSDLGNVASARSSLGLGTAATVNVGTGASDVPNTSQADARYLSVGGGTIQGNLSISHGSPILILRDTDTTGGTQVGYISFRDSTNTERAWLGFDSDAASTFNIQNSYDPINGVTINQNPIWHAGNFTPSSKASLSGDTFTGNINVPNASTGTHALNMNTADVRYVNTTGDTMSGNLTVPNAGSSGHAINLGQADARYLQSIPQATENQLGGMQVADLGEVLARSSNIVALTPFNSQYMLGSESAQGLLYMASNAVSNAGNVGNYAITPGNFSSSGQTLKSTNGYQRLPGGLIMQWGLTPSLDNAGQSLMTITFPIAFPTACLNIQATISSTSATGGSGSSMSVFVSQLNTSQFRILLDSANGSFPVPAYWFAIGY